MQRSALFALVSVFFGTALSQCDDVLDTVPQPCRPFISDTDGSAGACSETCGKPIYVYLKCLQENAENPFDRPADSFDLGCSKNADGMNCYDIFGDGSIFDTLTTCTDAYVADNGNSCPSVCEAIADSMNIDCCIYTSGLIFVGEQVIPGLLERCDVDNPGTCVGKFSDDPCNDELDAVPQLCLPFIKDTDGSANACSETCGKPLYEYFQCLQQNADDASDRPADSYDLGCAKNADGRNCYDVFGDGSIFDSLTECTDAYVADNGNSCPNVC